MATYGEWRDYRVPQRLSSAGAPIRWGQRNLSTEAYGAVVGVVTKDKGGRNHHAIYAKDFDSGKERSWRVSERDYQRVMDWARRRYRKSEAVRVVES